MTAEPGNVGTPAAGDYSRRVFFRTAPIVLLATLVAACAGDPSTEAPATPKIVQVFACSDYCPGPPEQYMKAVYEGVSDAALCRKLGGRPYTYVGWGERTVCEVQ